MIDLRNMRAWRERQHAHAIATTLSAMTPDDRIARDLRLDAGGDEEIPKGWRKTFQGAWVPGWYRCEPSPKAAMELAKGMHPGSGEPVAKADTATAELGACNNCAHRVRTRSKWSGRSMRRNYTCAVRTNEGWLHDLTLTWPACVRWLPVPVRR